VRDYSFNPESSFWELSFDGRPVSGTRCDDPKLGAIQYNEARAKFKAKNVEGNKKGVKRYLSLKMKPNQTLISLMHNHSPT